MTIGLLSGLFLSFAAVMAALVFGLLARFLDGRARFLALTTFSVWLLCAGSLGYAGIIAQKSPPGPAFLLVPIVVFVAAFLVRHPGVRRFAMRVPAALLIGLQVFRVGVELTLYVLFLNRLVPRLMTFEGGNLDILIGLSAPVVAWLFARRRINETAVRVWSWAGIALLANVVFRTLLTFSGVLHTEVPNVGLGLFPFTYIPGLLARSLFASMSCCCAPCPADAHKSFRAA